MGNETNLSDPLNATDLRPALLMISPSESVGVGVVFLITSILAIVGNVMVIVAVARFKKLQTVTNAFVVCLSTANLVTSLSMPWSAVGLLSWEGWPMDSEAPCYVGGLFLLTSIGASLFSLAAIAVNRLLSVKASPGTYQWCYTPAKVASIISGIWLVPFLIVLIPPLFDVGQIGYDQRTHTCEVVSQHPHSKDQQLAIAMIFYPIPMTTIILSYWVILLAIRQNFKHQLEATTNQPSDFDWGAGHKSRKSRLKHQQLSITINLFVNVCVFLVLNFPFGVALILPDDFRLTLFTAMVFLMHSFVHPIVYSLKHPQFNQAFRQMLHLTEEPQPSSGSAYTHSEMKQTTKLGKLKDAIDSSRDRQSMHEHNTAC